MDLRHAFHDMVNATIPNRVRFMTSTYSWPRYVELHYLELPVISNRIGFPLDLPLFFSNLLWAILNSVISNTPLSRTVSRSPKRKTTPAISNFITFQRNTGQHQSGSAVKAPPDKMSESWEMYWCVHSNGSKVRLTWLTTANAEGDKLPVFVNFRDQSITPEIWLQPRYLEPCYL